MTEQIFKRKIYDTILKWKSTIAKEFAKREYKSFVAIDFAKASDAVKGI